MQILLEQTRVVAKFVDSLVCVIMWMNIDDDGDSGNDDEEDHRFMFILVTKTTTYNNKTTNDIIKFMYGLMIKISFWVCSNTKKKLQ